MEVSTFFGCTADQKFGSTDQKFGCLNPHHFLVGLTKNQGPPDPNFDYPIQIAESVSLHSHQMLVTTSPAFSLSMRNFICRFNFTQKEKVICRFSTTYYTPTEEDKEKQEKQSKERKKKENKKKASNEQGYEACSFHPT